MRILKHLSLYTFVGFLGAGINFFLLPYLSHFIEPSEYGILSLINTYVTILIPLVGLVASGIISIEYYRMNDKEEFKKLFSSVQLIPIVPGVLFFLISLAIPGTISRGLEIPIDKSYWIPLSVLIAFFSIYYESLLAFTVAQQQPVRYVLFNILRLGIDIPLTVLLVTQTKYGWEGRLMAWFISSGLLTTVAFYYFRKEQLLTRQVSWQYMKMGILFGLPLILHTVGKFIINQADRLFIAKLVSLEEAGIYNIGYQVGMIMLFFVTAAGNYIYPYLNERLASLNEAKKKDIVKLTYTILGFFLILVFCISVAAPFFFKLLVDAKYAGGVRFVFWVALSYFFWGVYIVFAGYLYYAKKTRFLGYIALLNVVVNLVMNYFLIKQFGAIGAAYATCISFFIFSMLVFAKSNTLYKMPWLYFMKTKYNKNEG